MNAQIIIVPIPLLLPGLPLFISMADITKPAPSRIAAKTMGKKRPVTTPAAAQITETVIVQSMIASSIVFVGDN
ncbi:MAG: hypothetical protein A2534_02970 [Candidatus Magasanikbacteria bacterium RIFOXYD2_FULL_39_9]|uniref:Uncharacterized protein n=1 Tax=Candidatus Magasanikbacteria bacterium RIFOXYD1_FULL_40_23 TaxID=1798705 RepID=A0A1F6P861_9BACT|nr:MAG: hypothetical protein A2534_02970 [Candidatus Magasanikbacteria bacterium RIFOXYD2_FULL_39_9]OGH92298.1 MAG: hypothetical protein A2563_04920 [Candidatus Magasanikbacteria bacterium RIFOXYD1_FULL_40_23]